MKQIEILEAKTKYIIPAGRPKSSLTVMNTENQYEIK